MCPHYLHHVNCQAPVWSNSWPIHAHSLIINGGVWSLYMVWKSKLSHILGSEPSLREWENLTLHTDLVSSSMIIHFFDDVTPWNIVFSYNHLTNSNKQIGTTKPIILILLRSLTFKWNTNLSQLHLKLKDKIFANQCLPMSASFQFNIFSMRCEINKNVL